jgi:hypothetical protein
MIGAIVRRRRRRVFDASAILFGVLGVGALAWIWHTDRARAWENPFWDPAQFRLVRGDVSRAPADSVLWLVPVNPVCRHCQTALANAAIVRWKHSPPVRLEALLVDTPRRHTQRGKYEGLADRVWWDARGIWRRRWGHRVYGEVLVFEASGRLVRTLPAGSDLEATLMAALSPGLGVPPDDF